MQGRNHWQEGRSDEGPYGSYEHIVDETPFQGLFTVTGLTWSADFQGAITDFGQTFLGGESHQFRIFLFGESWQQCATGNTDAIQYLVDDG